MKRRVRYDRLDDGSVLCRLQTADGGWCQLFALCTDFTVRVFEGCPRFSVYELIGCLVGAAERVANPRKGGRRAR